MSIERNITWKLISYQKNDKRWAGLNFNKFGKLLLIQHTLFAKNSIFLYQYFYFFSSLIFH